MFSWTSPKCIGLVAHVQQDPDELRSSTGSFDNSYGGVKICDFSFTDLLHLQCPTSLYGRTRNLWIDSGGTPCSSSQHTFEVFAKPHISVRNLTKTTPICVVVSHTHSLNRRTVSKHTSVGFGFSCPQRRAPERVVVTTSLWLVCPSVFTLKCLPQWSVFRCISDAFLCR